MVVPLALALPDPSLDRAALGRAEAIVTESTLGAERDRLVRLVRRLLAWPADAAEVEDVVQEALLRAWTRRDQLRDEGALGAWLQRIAVHAARNHLRSRRRRSWISTFASLGANDGEVVAADSGDAEARDLTRTALGRLGSRDRELLVLRYLEGNSGEQIRELLGLRRAAFDTRMARARQRLRSELESLEAER